MGKQEEKWNEMEQEYKKHSMSKEQVDQMKQIIEKAKRENKKTRRRQIYKCSAAAAAAVVILITVIPNAFPSAAYAMSRIPILDKWIEVVTFRDYQYDDGRHTADITVPELVPQPSTAQTDPNTDTTAQKQAQKTAEEINAEIQQISKQLIQEFEENAKNQDGYQDMQIKSEVIATTDAYFTLKLICYQAAGSGYEQNYFYTMDLQTGKRLQLKDLFTEDSDYIQTVSENIKTQMKEQMQADENVIYWLDSDMPEWNFKEITDDASFYLNGDQELVICFNEGEIAPMYMGCVEFIIPQEAIADIRK